MNAIEAGIRPNVSADRKTPTRFALMERAHAFLPEIPPREYRNIDRGLKETAGHELNHALVAYSLGVGINTISVIPEGNILGKTTFSNIDNPHAFKLIAAAGAVHTVDGPASGFGSDLYKAHLLTHIHGGQTVESAKSGAQAIINSFSHEIRDRVSEMIAFKGEVDGSLLPSLIRRAQMEIEAEKGLAGMPKEEIQKSVYIPSRPIISDYERPNYVGKPSEWKRKYVHLAIRRRNKDGEEEIVSRWVIIEEKNDDEYSNSTAPQQNLNESEVVDSDNKADNNTIFEFERPKEGEAENYIEISDNNETDKESSVPVPEIEVVNFNEQRKLAEVRRQIRSILDKI